MGKKRAHAELGKEEGIRKRLKKEKKHKKSKKKGKERDNGTIQKPSAPKVEPETQAEEMKDEIEYPYPVEESDHCETPAEAYKDIAEFLTFYATRLGKEPSELSIYDPYFCEGSMKARLAESGFPKVYNKCEDFYEKIRTETVPEYDGMNQCAFPCCRLSVDHVLLLCPCSKTVLVTNPPYSLEHVPKLLEFCGASNKPFFLLMPNWVYNKDYYWSALSSKATKPIQPFYICPAVRYQYSTPKGRRQKKSGKRTAPFPSFWYCHLGPHTASAMKWWMFQKTKTDRQIDVAATENDIPVKFLDQNDPRMKKIKNIQKRQKYIARKKAQRATQ